MKASNLIFFLSLKLLLVFIDPRVNGDGRRRNLHQPLDPTTLASPPSPPPPESTNPDQPTPSPSNVSIPSLPSSIQQSFAPIKTLGIVCSVAVVTLGMLSALAFFLYRQRIKYRFKSRMLAEKERSLSFRMDSGIPRWSLLNFGTMEQRTGENGEGESPAQRPRFLSPELQPLPPLSQHRIVNPTFETPFSDDESRETVFHTPEWTAAASYGGGVVPRNNKETPYNSPIIQAKETSPLPNLDDSLIKQDHHRPPPPSSPAPSTKAL